MRTALALLTLLCAAGLPPAEGWAAPAETPSDTRFELREPLARVYRVEPVAGPVAPLSISLPAKVLRGRPEDNSTNDVLFEDRVVLGLRDGQDRSEILQGRPLRLDRVISDHLFILQAPDAWTALRQARDLAQDARVIESHPVTRRWHHLLNPVAPRPNDPLFSIADPAGGMGQANLENRDTNAVPLGIDLNIREAWAISRGDQVVVAVADDGVELDHPDLVERTRRALHYNFIGGDTNGMPSGFYSSHATSVAGLIAATKDNHIGIAGVAPRAGLASWVIFGSNDELVSEEVLMDVFQYQSNVVSVQNHSWGKVGLEQLRVSSLENSGLENAIEFGRGGRGVIFVRAAGNGREQGNDANEDGYLADPRVIAVAAARLDGQFARYSSPGACVLVAAPSGDASDGVVDPCLADSPNLTTTDRQGSNGYNRSPGENGNYAFGETGFSGTSAATPQISGVAALILSVNPKLTYRDVQQVLILASRQFFLADPLLVTNAAGLRVSHNSGFGIPDAAVAAGLARSWSNRPALTVATYTQTNRVEIPDDGLRLRILGTDVPENLQSIRALPGGGRHPDATAAALPLVNVGNATEPIQDDLRGKIALIQRGPNFFCEKLTFAAQAGAQSAVIYNHVNGSEQIFMVEADRAPIPSYFISQEDGEALRDYLTAQPEARLEVDVHPAVFTFNVTETLQCEFVGVRLNTDHAARGDLRVVLVSPSGTKSILQHSNRDGQPGPQDWAYYSVQNFFESSFGRWTLQVSDENDQGTGAVTDVSLVIRGVAISDTDHDGLDDSWEMKWLGTLAYGPAEDPDGDGYSNCREQIVGSNPAAKDLPLQLDLSRWDDRLARLSWPSDTNTLYRVQIGSDSPKPLALLTNVPGRLVETELYLPYTHLLHEFFRIQAVPRGN